MRTMAMRPGRPIAIALACSGVIALGVAAFTSGDGSLRRVGIVGIGVAIGAVLFSTRFGFASAFRRAAEGDFSVYRAHALMFAIASALMVPVIAAGSIFGQEVYGFATPIGIALVIGGALFGIGMQLAGGCASGTLFMLGGGDLKFAATLVFFIVGSTIGAAHIEFWRALPAFEPLVLSDADKWPTLLTQEICLLLIAALALPRARPVPRALWLGAVGLALLNAATLVVAGRPWSETYGFALWGSKIAAHLGFAPQTWAFWHGGDGLSASVFADITSLMDFSILLGAFAAAVIVGRFRPTLGGNARAWAAAAVGGLMMGYGARLADGCNIGAYFSAIASGSMSGWIWALAALAGSRIGIHLRRWATAPWRLSEVSAGDPSVAVAPLAHEMAVAEDIRR